MLAWHGEPFAAEISAVTSRNNQYKAYFLAKMKPASAIRIANADEANK